MINESIRNQQVCSSISSPSCYGCSGTKAWPQGGHSRSLQRRIEFLRCVYRRPDSIFFVNRLVLFYHQILQAQGKYQSQPPFPFILGSEFAGKIAANSPIPAGCPYKPGDRVFGFAQGAYAERVAATWDVLVPLPKTMTYDEGAGVWMSICLYLHKLKLVFRTSYYLAHQL